MKILLRTNRFARSELQQVALLKLLESGCNRDETDFGLKKKDLQTSNSCRMKGFP